MPAEDPPRPPGYSQADGPALKAYLACIDRLMKTQDRQRERDRARFRAAEKAEEKRRLERAASRASHVPRVRKWEVQSERARLYAELSRGTLQPIADLRLRAIGQRRADREKRLLTAMVNGAGLCERAARIVRARLHGRTLGNIARDCGLSRERVRQICAEARRVVERRALEALRK